MLFDKHHKVMWTAGLFFQGPSSSMISTSNIFSYSNLSGYMRRKHIKFLYYNDSREPYIDIGLASDGSAAAIVINHTNTMQRKVQIINPENNIVIRTLNYSSYSISDQFSLRFSHDNQWLGVVSQGGGYSSNGRPLNILKSDTTSKRSIKGKRKKAGWSNGYMAKLLKSFIVTGA
ncbi:hypothetical protein GZ77_08320 [Endozoicomonas montiporae]|uniref:Uncharacterized protein n=2 Tax=Endozoicomonas montiporae TaxID=1027273 RepID=A0A081N7F5_9GAMM|nr:hypothetical protein GZ77_08320 [Endozoicomonas montiporae]